MDIYAFPLADPDEPFGVINTFYSIDEALKFAAFIHKASFS